MKKVFISVLLFIIFLIILFLQANFFPAFTIAGVAPNLFIIFALYIGLFTNQLLGVSSGVIMGLILDAIYGQSIGLTAIMLCGIGFLGSRFDKNFSKDNKMTIMLMVMGCTLLGEFVLYALKAIIMQFNFEIFQFIRIVLLEILYNALLCLIFYPLTQKLGYILDRNFKNNNLLTRYF